MEVSTIGGNLFVEYQNVAMKYIICPSLLLKLLLYQLYLMRQKKWKALWDWSSVLVDHICMYVHMHVDTKQQTYRYVAIYAYFSQTTSYNVEPHSLSTSCRGNIGSHTTVT